MPEKTFSNTKEKILSRGYLLAGIYPQNLNNSLGSPPELKGLVKELSVQFRGWDYPHIPQERGDNQGIFTSGNSIKGWIDWDRHKEVWVFEDTGVFVHLRGLPEDWEDESEWVMPENPLTPGEILSVGAIVYTVTEIYSFLSKLCEHDEIGESIGLKIKLNNTENRTLKVRDNRRAPLFLDYTTSNENILFVDEVYKKEDILLNDRKLALEALEILFHQFEWGDPPLGNIEEMQKKLLERRL